MPMPKIFTKTGQNMEEKKWILKNNTRLFFLGIGLVIAFQRRLYDEKSMVFESVGNLFICMCQPFFVYYT